MAMQQIRAFSRRLARAACVLAAAAAVAGGGPASARGKAFDEAVQQYRAGHLSDAFGRFFALANEGDPDAARIALFMHQYGPVLYGRYWEAHPHEVAAWQALQGKPTAHAEPPFRPQWLDQGSFRRKPSGQSVTRTTAP